MEMPYVVQGYIDLAGLTPENVGLDPGEMRTELDDIQREVAAAATPGGLAGAAPGP